MCLKTRVNEINGRFYVKEKKVDSTRKLYYRFFEIHEDYEAFTVDEMTPLQYWDQNNGETSEIKIQSGKFVLLAETDNKEFVERHWIYFEDEIKNSLKIEVKKNTKYGNNAHMITIIWGKEKDPESINSRYIYLLAPSAEKYHFLTELIEPEDPFGRKREDKYIFELPENDTLKNYSIGVEEILNNVFNLEVIVH